MPNDVLFAWKTFLDDLEKKEGHRNGVLIMHTDPNDMEGPNLLAVSDMLGLNDNVWFSNDRLQFEQMNVMHNLSDVTVNVSKNEGFGLSTLESLNCGTPIIVPRTGGLQEQVTDGIETFGVMIDPASQYVIGSQEVPYIYEDKISGKDFIEALEKIYRLSSPERKKIGQKGREHALKNYGFSDYQNKWVNLMTKVYEERGSWENRKQYSRWTLKEVK